MNKPPERLRVHFDELGTMIAVETREGGFGRTGARHGKLTEHFYVLEKEQMERKIGNLTTKEAWAAMVRGECVEGCGTIYRIDDTKLQYWSSYYEWNSTSNIDDDLYSIVPDPSKPKELSEVDELVIQFAEFVDEKVGGKYEPEQDLNQADLTRLMLDFINSKFARKP